MIKMQHITIVKSLNPNNLSTVYSSILTIVPTNLSLDINIVKANSLFNEYGLVKACNETRLIFRNESAMSFISHIPHLHYQRKDSSPICVFPTLETYKQRRSDSCLTSEPSPVGHNKYQVLLNYRQLGEGLVDSPAISSSP